MPKVIVFGNLPLWAGGKQSSGASMVMWELAERINRIQAGFEVEFIATDITVNTVQKGKTIVRGWNIGVIVKAMFASFSRSVAYIRIALNLAFKYQASFVSAYVKLIWFDSVVNNNPQALFHIHGTDYFMLLENVFNRNGVSRERVIYTVHAVAGNDPNIPDYQYERLKEYAIARFQPYCICFVSSQLCREWMATYGNNKWTVIPNAIHDSYLEKVKGDELANRKYDEGVKVLITIASISQRKGQMRVLEALSKTVNKKSIVYRCVGNSDQEALQEMKLFAARHEINFEYLGVLEPSEVAKQLSAAHFMILPSSSEGFGLVYAESICTGTPVIIPARLPFVSEAKLNESNSVLLEDHTQGAILQVLDNIHSYRFNSNTVAHSIQQLSWTEVAAKYIDLYKEMYERNR